MRLSNYTLNYPVLFREGKMDIFRFLSLCRGLGADGASLHMRHLENTDAEYLRRVRRAYLDQGLSVSQVTVSTDFGRSADRRKEEVKRAQEAVRVALFLGAPLIRIFAGSPAGEADRAESFRRAAGAVRTLCDWAAKEGMPVGLQNHNHGALCRTGVEVRKFVEMVDHPNLTVVLDTGQFAGSKGASGKPPPELPEADYLASIRETASMARYVRAKFYNPRLDGSEPFLDYPAIFSILRGVHYAGFVDIVYEPGTGTRKPGEDPLTAIPRVVSYLRNQLAEPARAASPESRYRGIGRSTFLMDDPRSETAVAFTEGPTVDRKGDVYFSNIPMQQILRWDPRARRLSVFREKSNGANGLRFDRQGRLVVCESGAGRLTRIEMATGSAAVLVESHEGQPLGAPNDLEIDSAGRIYFSSRFGGKQGSVRPNGVYRLDPDGRLQRVLASPAIDMPNGLALSPDEQILYLIDADGGERRARRIRAYDVAADGSLSNERTVYDFYPGRSGDGMKVDAEGNLYVMAGLHRRRGSSETLDTRPGIHVISPQGKLLAFAETPEDSITNCAFGGPDLRTLYVTCGKQLLSIRTRIPGKPSYRPDA